MMEARAVIRYVRISPQKVRKIVEPIKGKPVESALNTLKFMPQKASGFVEKALRSAVSNADQHHDLDVDALVVRNIYIDQGPVLKRFRARARGRGSRILKRTSHITVIVAQANF